MLLHIFNKTLIEILSLVVMYKHNIGQLFFLAWNIINSYLVATTDLCNTNQDDCLIRKAIISGEIVLGKCLRNRALLQLQDISLLDCIRSCKVTSKCTSVNYRKSWNLCDLNEVSEDDISEDRGCVYTNTSSWQNTMTGECYGHNCKRGTQCIGKHKDGTFQCKLAYCSGYPWVRHGILVEKFGMHRNIGHAVKYSCEIGLKLAGRPIAVCQKTGLWKSFFICGDIRKVSNGKPTGLSSPFDPKTSKFESWHGVDGNKSTFFHTGREENPYWWVNFEKNFTVVRVVSTNRHDAGGERLGQLVVYVGNTLQITEMSECGRFDGPGRNGQIMAIECTEFPVGNYVKLVNVAINFFHLSEVEVYAV